MDYLKQHWLLDETHQAKEDRQMPTLSSLHGNGQLATQFF